MNRTPDLTSPFRTLAERVNAFQNAALYPVISPEFCGDRTPLQVFEAVVAGGAKIVQLRCKNMSDADLYQLACACRPIASAERVLLIIDDRIDIALASGADGVHLGQSDLPVTAAKRISGELLLGISTHNAEEIKSAHSSGADYLNIGPIFATRTKSSGYPAIGIENLRKWLPLVSMPFSVMGGIKTHHLPALQHLGVTHPAMVTEITQAEDICRKTRELIHMLFFFNRANAAKALP